MWCFFHNLDTILSADCATMQASQKLIGEQTESLRAGNARLVIRLTIVYAMLRSLSIFNED